jgi:4-hydroxythreonine-4-phosphate dehydrogenase
MPIALTMGDPAGIGPEILVKAWKKSPQITRACFVVGDVQVMRQACVLWGEGLQAVTITGTANLAALPAGVLPVLSGVVMSQLPQMGRVQPECGAAAAQCVQVASRMALRGEVVAIVTAPLNKEAMQSAGVHFPGHTELLSFEAGKYLGAGQNVPVRMMLMNDELRVVLLSIHVSLREALEAVTVDNILETLIITQEALSRTLGRTPYIWVAGLNPHAGENGLMGREELEIIAPAVQQAQASGLQVRGPFPPDTVFMSARARWGQPKAPDVVLAMYHDQGLIPVKYLGVDKGVNVTLGLPFVRTSPDHGTAFDIAGHGRADPSSLLEAVRTARALLRQTGP